MFKFLSLIITAFLLASCQEKQDEDALIVGTSPDNPPYEFIKDGEIIGIDIDIVKAIAKELNKKLIIKNMEFPALLAALATGNVDIVAAGMSITPERAIQVNFSVPYTKASVVALFRVESDFKNEDDLKNIKIGAQLGSFWNQIANEISIDKDNNVKTLSNNLTLVQELKNGAVDALIMEEYQAKKFKEKNPNLRSFSLNKYSSEFALVFSKYGSNELKEKVNKVITKLNNEKIIEIIETKWLKD